MPVDYDNLFSRPIVPTEPFTPRENPAYLSRHRNALWWLLIFTIIILTTAALLIADASSIIVDPPCE